MRISDWSSDVCSSDLPDRYTIRAEGTVDRRDLTLLTPAVVTREGAGWRLAKTRLSFAGGEAEIGGHAGGGAVAIDAKLAVAAVDPRYRVSWARARRQRLGHGEL